jgi:hypothetical protein
MAKRLLDRQSSLLAYLTSNAAIFGDKDGASLDASLHGIDPALLGLEARFSHEKRMEKIVAVFPRTFDVLDGSRATIIREFTAAYPPADIGRLANAGQFLDFLSARGRRDSDPPYLRDLAACELAFAQVRSFVEQQDPRPMRGKERRSRRAIRRSPGAMLLRCAYDVRPIFEQGAMAAPEKRDTPLAVAMPPEADDPQVFELLPVVFDLLGALDEWTNSAAFGETPEVDGLVADLVRCGLIEVRG